VTTAAAFSMSRCWRTFGAGLPALPLGSASSLEYF